MTEQHVVRADAAGALLATWSPDDFRRFANYMCGYAPEIVQRWHHQNVEPSERKVKEQR